MAGAKEAGVFTMLPYLQMGWSVVNVEYRLTNVALAPAAVEDARCALRWVYRNAQQYNFDTRKIVTTGQSAGGHLALTTGMIPASAGFDNTCPGDRAGGASAEGPNNTGELKVAAIVDWYGITDVAELVSGPNIRVHGDADPTVPYTQKQRLHEALGKAGLPHELVTIPAGKHGGFSDAENLKAYAAIRAFLGKFNLSTTPLESTRAGTAR